jgi:CHAD domain-containing protein
MTRQRHQRFPAYQDRPPREVELKLAIPDGSANALGHLRTRAGGAGFTHQRHQVTTYFDTPDRGRQIRHRSEAELHALRKSPKKLRYGIDFLRPVFDPAPLKPYMRDCKKLQQILGDINDTVTATTLAERLVKGTQLDLAPAVAALAEPLDRRRGDALSLLAKRWDAFSDQPPFWA